MQWYKCDCGSEVLHIEEDVMPITDNKLATDGKLIVYLNVSIMHIDSRRSIWNRLRHCWHILKTGKNYADEIILNWDNMKKLSEDLQAIMDKYEEDVYPMTRRRKQIQLDCRHDDCRYYAEGGDCTCNAPAITLNPNKTYVCWSQ